MTTKVAPRPTTGIIEDSAIKFDAEGKEIVEWEIKLFGSKFPQPMRVPKAVGLRRPGESVNILVTRGKPKGNGDPKSDWSWWWNFAGLQTAVPPAGSPELEEPFPIPGTSKTPPVSAEKAPASLSSPQESTQTPSTPEKAPSTLDRPPLYPTADKYSGANIAWETWGYDRRAALERAVALLLDDRTETSDWRELADAMFAWLRGCR